MQNKAKLTYDVRFGKGFDLKNKNKNVMKMADTYQKKRPIDFSYAPVVATPVDSLSQVDPIENEPI